MADDEAEPTLKGDGIIDTNMDILPGTRAKGGGGGQRDEEPTEKKMSKRKKRKLAQLEKKHASKALRTSVLGELQTVQLTSEQMELMRASQSTRVSRRDKVAMAKRRLANGLALTDDMKHLRRRKSVENCSDEGSDEVVEAGESTNITTGMHAVPDAVPAPVISFANASSEKSTVVTEQDCEMVARTSEPPQACRKDSAPNRSVVSQLMKPVRVSRTGEIEEQRSKLPAVMCEQEVVETVMSNDVVLISGDTGCGKSTQIPQFLYEAGVCNGDQYLIAVTQPRRVAAISVSQRVGQEINEVGTVGYQVRYDRSHCSSDTRIKFMTDGILLREMQADFLLQKYAVVIIDEAHERGVNCDILIGLLSRAVQRRRKNYEEALAAGKYEGLDKRVDDVALPPPPLRVVIMSATLRVCDFTENKQLFPIPPPVVKIDARTFPVTVHFARYTEEDYIKAAHRSVLQIHKQLPPGTVLVFVTGRQEVHRLSRLLRRSNATLRGAEGSICDEKVEDDALNDDDDLGLLEASDDEAGAFDDDLGTGSSTAQAGNHGEDDNGTRTNPEGRDGNDAQDVQALADATPKRRTKKGKKRKTSHVGALPSSEKQGATNSTKDTEKIAEVATESSSTKIKKRKKNSAVKANIDKSDAQNLDQKTSAEEITADTDEIEVSYRIDAEEDVVVLEAETIEAEDAKDFEAKRQKRQKMVKLDKSRTAGGVFRGAGFGEGPMRVYPLYAQLPAREQLAAFVQPREGERNIIVATNVAETSVTLPNVRYVVDAGHEKRRKYRAASGVSAFSVERISKASSDQRAGRAGRLGPGHSYRLYSAAAYENHMTQFAPIAVLHVPMEPVLLLIASLGVPFLDLFPWPTPPPAESIAAAMRRLQALGALALVDATHATKGKALRCTKLGFRLATLPVAPRYAKMLLSAVESCDETSSHVVGHACALVAALSVGNLISPDAMGNFGADIEDDEQKEGENELVRARRAAQKKLQQAREKDAPRWTQLKDDADGLLWLMGGYAWAISKSEAHADRFCVENRANSRQMSEAHSLMQQLGSLLRKRLSLESAGVHLDLPLKPIPPNPEQARLMRGFIVDGLVDRVAVARPELGRNAYVCADLGLDTAVYIHSSSNTYRHRPRPTVMVFNEIIASSRPFMRDLINVDPLLLSKRAALGDCQLLQLGEFLAVPAPRYLKDKDAVLAFASPSYASLGHTLPTVEVEVPSDSIFRYKVFAKALLDGEVIDSLPASGSQLLARPTLVLHAPNNQRVMSIVGPLWEQRIGSRAELLQRWSHDRRFLLDGYLRWLPPSMHDDVRMAWPPSSNSKKSRW